MLSERIRRARILRGLSLQQVADQLGDITKQALSKYEQGKDTPNSTRLILLAEVFGVEPEYFFREDTVELGEVDFRKHSSLGKRQQEAIKEQVKELLERYLAIENCFESENLSPSFQQWRECYAVSSPEEAEQAADDLRDSWDLGSNPISNLTEVLEENGVKVIGIDAHERFDGLCAFVNGGQEAVIVSNISGRYGDRQRFNLAHELGHLVMKLPEALHDTKEEELLCHRFAGAFLFPADQLIGTFGQHRKRILIEEFKFAKLEWAVSMQAILHRLQDLNVISKSYYQSTRKYWNYLGILKKEPVEIDPEPSYRMKHLVYRALAERVITPSRAAELLNSSVHEIEKILGGGEQEGKDANEGSRI